MTISEQARLYYLSDIINIYSFSLFLHTCITSVQNIVNFLVSYVCIQKKYENYGERLRLIAGN